MHISQVNSISVVPNHKNIVNMNFSTANMEYALYG